MAVDARLDNDEPRHMPQLDEQAEDAQDLPSPDEALPDIVIYSHSSLIYWWPVWLVGFACAAVTYLSGSPFIADDGESLKIYSGTSLGLTWLTVTLLTLIITNARLYGIYSVVALLSVALIFVSVAWFGWLDDIAKAIPELSVHMNAGFFLVTSTALFLIWAAAFFVFDRLTWWRVRPGQLTQESWIGDSEESFDTRGMLFEKHGEDFMRHRLLGLGSGDLRLTTAGAKQKTISISDVLMVDRTVEDVQRLIAVEPDSLMNR